MSSLSEKKLYQQYTEPEELLEGQEQNFIQDHVKMRFNSQTLKINNYVPT